MEPDLKEVEVSHNAEANGDDGVVINKSSELWFQLPPAVPVRLVSEDVPEREKPCREQSTNKPVHKKAMHLTRAPCSRNSIPAYITLRLGTNH